LAFLFEDLYVAQAHAHNLILRIPAHLCVGRISLNDGKGTIRHQDWYWVLLDDRLGHPPGCNDLIHLLLLFGDIVVNNKDTLDRALLAGNGNAVLPEPAD